MADTSTLELRFPLILILIFIYFKEPLPDLQIPDTLIVKNTKKNADDNSCINNDKKTENVNLILNHHRSFRKNFQQQTLPGWYFTPSIKCSLISTFFCGLILIILGIVNVVVTSHLVEVMNKLAEISLISH